MRVKFLLIFLFFFLASTRSFAQRKIGFEWWLPPVLDRLDQNYVDSPGFKIYNGDKQGFYHLDYGIVVPAKYDSIKWPVLFDDYSFPTYWLTPVMNSGKWGAYALFIDGWADTLELLPCEYDEVNIEKDNGGLPLINVRKSEKIGQFGPLSRRWLWELEDSTLWHASQFQGPRTQRIDWPIVLQEEKPNSHLTTPNVNTLFDGLEEIEAQPVEDPARYERLAAINTNKNDTNHLHLWRSIGERGQFMLVYNGKKTKVGVIKSRTQAIIHYPNYDNVRYYPGYFVLDSAKLSVVTDTLGKPLTPWWREVKLPYDNGNRYWMFQNDQGLYALYDLQLRELIPFKYKAILLYNEYNRIRVWDGHLRIFDINTKRVFDDSFKDIYANGDYNYVIGIQKEALVLCEWESSKKKQLDKFKYLWALDSMAALKKHDKYYLVNLMNGRIMRTDFDSIFFTEMFGNFRTRGRINTECQVPVYVAYKKGKIGLSDGNGKITLPCIYDSIYRPDENTLIFLKGGLIYIYSLCRKKIVEDSIDKISFFYSYRRPANFAAGDKPTHLDFRLTKYKKGNKLGLMESRGELLLPPTIDTILMSANHTIGRGAKGYLVVRFPDSGWKEYAYYDSFRLMHKQELLLYRNNKTDLINANGDYELRDSIHYLECLSCLVNVSNDPIYMYRINAKYGLLHVGHSNTSGIFEEVRYGANGLIWAKYNGKWGIVKY